ncbi:hypothetical protein Poly24_05020 [Rosistilla carotiformis]|uniref:Uncharacterized protein n=1 Tax=Rosistilla carotiformis TaxID=2528017 RepID=A0A518JMQ1_9BACT|nr:hypothetical protein [Rosistilla carotiformis]QDV66814.1 hypothetical protein Poly24_05020 [Rosistilla carotiformis]
MNLPESPDYLNSLQGGWEALGNGAPTLVALAQLCARALVEGSRDEEPLSVEAKAILFAARNRGVIEVRGVNTAFEATARLLAIYIEVDEHRTIAFRNREKPQVTVRFFDAFCQLCRSGLVLHHLYRDFSLTDRGFEVAAKIVEPEVAQALGQATEFGLHD